MQSNTYDTQLLPQTSEGPIDYTQESLPKNYDQQDDITVNTDAHEILAAEV